MSDIIVTLAGADVTDVCISGSWSPRLNRPSQAQVKINMEAATAQVGDPLKIELLVGTTFEIVFHGMVLLVETDTEEDGGYTTYNAQDPMELWQWRPVRADDGDFSKPAGSGETDGKDIIATYKTGPEILQAMLMNTEGDSTAQGNPALTPPSDAEGPTFLTFGTFETGGVYLSGGPVDFPMQIAEMTALLISTGQLDVVITPTDPGGGILGTVDAYNGDYGTDLSGSVAFQYGMGAYNVRRLRWNEDMTSMVNKYWLYGGPRVGTAADPAGDQHWCFNVTGDDPAFDPDANATGAWGSGTSYFISDTATNGGVTYVCLADHTSSAANEPGVGVDWLGFWAVWMVPPGGRLSPPASSNPLGDLIYSSRNAYGVRMQVDIFDGYDDCQGVGTIGRDLFRRRWQIYAWGAAQPRTLIHITPAREAEIGNFGIGDLVTVEASSAVRGGFSGVQRVYGYTVSWDEDSVLALSELQTSADMEGV